MFQPGPTGYFQVSTGYAIPHSLPDYTFEETPLRLSDGRDSVAAGPGGSAGPLLYGTPIFSTNINNARIGPAPSTAGSFPVDFHSTLPTTATSSVSATVSAASHHRPSLTLLPKMASNADDLVAQETAAREYQPHFQVTSTFNLAFGALPSQDPALTRAPRSHRDPSSATRRRAQPSRRNMQKPIPFMYRRQ
jgi:ubiquitin thioesterase protein OTUB1